ncbi:MAG: transposase [Saprospiraceae bacterium]|nr:transposase [Saprospiraceae bacterium]
MLVRTTLPALLSAIQASFPDTVTQLCIVHQIRNSVKFVPWKDRKIFIADLKEVYGAFLWQLTKFNQNGQCQFVILVSFIIKFLLSLIIF